MRRAAVAILVGVAVAAPLFASASHRVLHDANDSKGRLDVRKVVLRGEKIPRWKVVTWSDWRTRTILDRGYVLVRFDTRGSSRFDYYALIRAKGSRLKGSLFRDRRRRADVDLGPLAVWRPGRYSLKVRIRLRRMRFGDSRISYRWAVETIYSNRVCPNTCFDLAPDHGAVTEPRPGVTPTPTPTPTLTASPI